MSSVSNQGECGARVFLRWGYAMRLLFGYDVETLSAIDLKKYGGYLYARHPTTDVRCVSYCLVENSRRGPVKSGSPAIRRRTS